MKKTLFVVGAGASTDFNLPIGTKLTRRIEALIRDELESPGILTATAKYMSDGGNYVAAMRDLAGGLLAARSIDRFIDSRKGRPLVEAFGKCGIASALSYAEQNSTLAVGEPIGELAWSEAHAIVDASRSSWIAGLFALLVEGVSPEDSGSVFEDVSFVTFNYDRCIEHYLQLAFQHMQDQTAEAARDLVKQIGVEHVYGSLGPLPGLEEPGRASVPFGGGNEYLAFAAGEIRTFTETIDERIVQRVREQISKAEVVVFLGFGFDPLNVSLLFDRSVTSDQILAGTLINVPEPLQRNFLERAGPQHSNWRASPLPCADFVTSSGLRELLDR
jgi:hypothetical protein